MHITDLIQVETINGYLRQNFRVLDGRPIYRLVWSDDQLEIRKGKFSDWYGKIFIREYEAVREIKKYWYIKPPCWVLEKLIFMANAEVLKDIVSELVTAQNGTYEPVYSFKDAKDNPLPVDFEVVQFILQALHSPARKVDPELARRMQEK